MGKTIEVVLYRDADHWVALAFNVDISSFGDTLDEARDAMKEALELYFEGEPEASAPEASDVRVEVMIVS